MKARAGEMMTDDRKDLIRTTNDFNEVNRENWQLKTELEKALNLIDSLEEEKRRLEWRIEDLLDLDNEAGV